MRVFLDTNILISAIVFRGNEFQLVHSALRDGHDIVISEHIMDEAMSVMNDKFPEHLYEFVEFINTAEIRTIPKEIYLPHLSDYDDIRDSYDRHVLAAAVISKSDYIVTGDKDLLEYTTRKLKIVTTRKILRIL